MKALLAMVLAATAAFAQEPAEIQLSDNPAILASKWLRETNAIHKAWAISLVRREKLTSLIPDVERVLDLSSSADLEERDVESLQLLALDALIQLDVAVPSFTLQRFVDRCPGAVVMLAAKAPDDPSPLLMDLLPRANSYEAYVAVGNLLLQHPSPAFVQHLLSSIKVSLYLGVYDRADHDRPGFGPGSFFGDAASYLPSDRKGWPPVGLYDFTQKSSDGPLLAGGPHPIYWVRGESVRYVDQSFESRGEDNIRDKNARNQEYLATLQHVSPRDFPLKILVTGQLDWTNPSVLEADVREWIRTQRSIYEAIVQQFTQQSLLSPQQAADLQLHIGLMLYDRRKKDHGELPALAELATRMGVTPLN